MILFAVRAERVLSVMSAACRLVLVALGVIALLAVSVAPALTAASTNPFRWT